MELRKLTMETSLFSFNPRLNNKCVQWRMYTSNDVVCSRFLKEEWIKIADDIENDQDLCDLLAKYPHLIKGYILYENSKETPIAFVYLLNECPKKKIISLHGGGWEKSPRLTMLFMQGAILLIEHLLKVGFKVRTYCSKDNVNAYRFMQGLGFCCYRRTKTKLYQVINLKRLHDSHIYKYLKTRESNIESVR